VVVDLQRIDGLAVTRDLERGEMHDRLDVFVDVLEGLGIGHVGFDETETGFIQVRIQVGGAAHRQVVDTDDAMAFLQELAQEIRPEKTGDPRYEND
jgi:hypothetical protein